MINESAAREHFSLYGDLKEDAVVSRLCRMVQFETIANYDGEKTDFAPFRALHSYMQKAFSVVFQTCEWEVVNQGSLLLRWKGTGEEKPFLLMSHLDVVPVTPGTESDWNYPAFSGAVTEQGEIYGRGTLDIKNMVCAELCAAEYLMERGFRPNRDIYFAFGHDEEVGGANGAEAIATLLQSRGVRLEFVIDEGCGICHGERLGAPNTILGRVGIFEKGYLDLMLTAHSEGGHSSKPLPHTALGEVARAIVALEDHPMPASLPQPYYEYYRILGPHLEDEELRTYAKNLENDAAPLLDYLQKNPEGNAMVRTTAAATQAWGSPAGNVLPQKAQVNINFRLKPGDTLEDVLKHVKDTVQNDAIECELHQACAASKISITNGEGYALIGKVLHDFYPEALLVPMGMLGATDSRKFENICDAIYRFAPFFCGTKYENTVHATNEHIETKDLIFGTKFLIHLIVQAADSQKTWQK